MATVAMQRSRRQPFALALVIAMAVAILGVLPPASAEPVVWVGSVQVVTTQEGGDTGLEVSYSHAVTYSLAADATDTSETTWSGEVHYSVKDYSLAEPCAGLVSHTFYDATGEGSGADLLVTYMPSEGAFQISGNPTYIPIDVVRIGYDPCDGDSTQSIEAGSAAGPTPDALVVAPADAVYLAGESSREQYCTGGICVTYTTTYHLRRVDCDQSRDTDGGGVSDCLEFDRGTDPSDRDDDFPIDSDGDGVDDTADQCPGTPTGTPVDSFGCALDGDGDGVDDDRDECPDTPLGAVVDSRGCQVNRAPNAIDDSASTLVDQLVLIDVLSNDTDPDGDPLTLESCTQPTAGVATISEQAVAFVPDPRFQGTATFACTVSDPFGASDSATVTVVVTGGTIVVSGTYYYRGGVMPTAGANMAGTDAVLVTGPAEMLEGMSVCILSEWTATVQVRIATSISFLWNGQTRPFQDGRLTGTVQEKERKGLFTNEVTEIVTYRDCAQGPSAVFGPFPGSPVLSVTSPQAVISVSHSLTVEAKLKNGQTLEVSVGESKSRGQIKWAKAKARSFRY